MSLETRKLSEVSVGLSAPGASLHARAQERGHPIGSPREILPASMQARRPPQANVSRQLLLRRLVAPSRVDPILSTLGCPLSVAKDAVTERCGVDAKRKAASAGLSAPGGSPVSARVPAARRRERLRGFAQVQLLGRNAAPVLAKQPDRVLDMTQRFSRFTEESPRNRAVSQDPHVGLQHPL